MDEIKEIEEYVRLLRVFYSTSLEVQYFEQLIAEVKRLREGIEKVIDEQGEGIFTDRLRKLLEEKK